MRLPETNGKWRLLDQLEEVVRERHRLDDVLVGFAPTDGLTGETVAMVIDPEGNQTDAAICPSFVQQ